MSQRLTLMLSTMMTIACLAATGLAWATLRESREVNTAILEKLEGLQGASTTIAAPPEWSEVKVRAVFDEPSGAPAVGFQVSLYGHIYNLPASSESSGLNYGTLDETAGESGEVNFGLVRGGSYSVSVTSPWGESLHRSVSIRSGRPTVVEIVCPSKPPAQAKVQAAVNWPDELRNRSYLLRVSFVSCTRKTRKEDQWLTNKVPSLLIDTGNAVAQIEGSAVRQLKQQGLYRFPGALTFLPESTWAEGDYAVHAFEVYRPTDRPERRILVAQLQFQPGFNPVGGGMGGGMMGGGGGGFGGGGGGFFQIGESQNFDPMLISVAGESAPKFKVTTDEVSHWDISLPDELVENLLLLPETDSGTVTPDH